MDISMSIIIIKRRHLVTHIHTLISPLSTIALLSFVKLLKKWNALKIFLVRVAECLFALMI
jgi:hypothetical protein